ncbi:hypothetical protein EBZ39_09415 [bacterium]|nr:hypothetical protein [bacterium]
MVKGGFQGAIGGGVRALPNTVMNAITNATASGAGEGVRQGFFDGVFGENNRGVVPQLVASTVAGAAPQLAFNALGGGLKLAKDLFTPVDKIEGVPTGYSKTLLDNTAVDMSEGATGLPKVGKYFEQAAQKISNSAKDESKKVSELYRVAGEQSSKSVLQPKEIENLTARIAQIRSTASGEIASIAGDNIVDQTNRFFLNKMERENGVSLKDVADWMKTLNSKYGGADRAARGEITRTLSDFLDTLGPAEVGSKGVRAVQSLKTAVKAASENFKRFSDPADIASIVGVDRNGNPLSNMQVAEIFKSDANAANRIKAAINTVKDAKTKDFVKENIVKGMFNKVIVDATSGEVTGAINPSKLSSGMQELLRNEDFVSLLKPQQISALRNASNLLIGKFDGVKFADIMNLIGAAVTGGRQTKGLGLSIMSLFSGDRSIDLKMLKNFLDTPSQEVAEILKRNTFKDYMKTLFKNSGVKEGFTAGGISTLQNTNPQ